MLKPADPAKGKHRVLFDVVNRGRKRVLEGLTVRQDDRARGGLDPGNGFLMRQGYTVVWGGW